MALEKVSHFIGRSFMGDVDLQATHFISVRIDRASEDETPLGELPIVFL